MTALAAFVIVGASLVGLQLYWTRNESLGKVWMSIIKVCISIFSILRSIKMNSRPQEKIEPNETIEKPCDSLSSDLDG
jgi:hypothetical protein